jgi:hypothetical protein
MAGMKLGAEVESTDPAVHEGISAESWRGFEERIQQRRLRILGKAIRTAADEARTHLLTLQRALDEARELSPRAPELRELESVASDTVSTVRIRTRRRLSSWTLAFVAVIICALPATAAWTFHRTSGAVPVGFVRVVSEPAGALVQVDGAARGTTPLRIPLPPGRHDVVVDSGSRRTTLIADITPGQDTVHYVAWVADAPTLPAAPAAAAVVPVRTRSNTAPPATTTAPLSDGWVSVASPLPLDVVDESGHVIGTSEMSRIALPPGVYGVILTSAPLGYSTQQTVRVRAGRVSQIAVDLPSTTLSINATPWADVFVDGRPVGQTPLGNLSVAIGDHQVEFRHPQYGVKHETVRVTLKAPARIAVDMSAP